MGANKRLEVASKAPEAANADASDNKMDQIRELMFGGANRCSRSCTKTCRHRKRFLLLLPASLQPSKVSMEFYYNPLSTYSQKALIAFHEKGVKFEPKIVNLIDPGSRAEFEQIYPIGKLPYFKPSADYAVPESLVDGHLFELPLATRTNAH
jgi:glutathione S-transferase-like protein